mgnify:CR=1 FL=1
MRQIVVETALGRVQLSFAEDALWSVALTESPVGGDPVDASLWQPVVSVLNGEEEGDTIPKAVRGSEFQALVWQAIAAIPRGEVATYHALARAIGRPSSVRAVANACGANPWVGVVPCHRVIRSDGGLGGFAWGLDLKRTLLAREGVSLSE